MDLPEVVCGGERLGGGDPRPGEIAATEPPPRLVGRSLDTVIVHSRRPPPEGAVWRQVGGGRVATVRGGVQVELGTQSAAGLYRYTFGPEFLWSGGELTQFVELHDQLYRVDLATDYVVADGPAEVRREALRIEENQSSGRLPCAELRTKFHAARREAYFARGARAKTTSLCIYHKTDSSAYAQRHLPFYAPVWARGGWRVGEDVVRVEIRVPRRRLATSRWTATVRDLSTVWEWGPGEGVPRSLRGGRFEERSCPRRSQPAPQSQTWIGRILAGWRVEAENALRGWARRAASVQLCLDAGEAGECLGEEERDMLSKAIEAVVGARPSWGWRGTVGGWCTTPLTSSGVRGGRAPSQARQPEQVRIFPGEVDDVPVKKQRVEVKEEVRVAEEELRRLRKYGHRSDLPFAERVARARRRRFAASRRLVMALRRRSRSLDVGDRTC